MKRYTPAHKKLVLRLYHEVFRKNVHATCRYTEVPERTLRDWIYAARRAAATRKPAATVVQNLQRRP